MKSTRDNKLEIIGMCKEFVYVPLVGKSIPDEALLKSDNAVSR